jgi:hypothetical protein
MSVEKMPQLIPSPEPFLFRTSMAHEQVTKDLILSRAKSASLRTGDPVIVQCVTHHGDELIAECEYRVIRRSESIQTRDLDGYQTRQDTHLAIDIAMIRDWWFPNRVASIMSTALKVSWNPGRKMHQVKDGDRVVFESTDKDEAIAFGQRAA